MVAELPRASRGHLMSPRQEPANRFVDMVVSRPVGHQPRAVAEVARPPRRRLFNRVRTSSQGATLDGTMISATRTLRRCTLFGDGLAPRYRWPSFRKWCGPKL